jgi:cytochrome c-type biogenesis protein CcmH/NrfG
MKKEYAFLFIGLAFITGIILGVVVTVYYEEKYFGPTQFSPTTPDSKIYNQIEQLQATLKNNPQDLQALIALGNAYFDTNQFAKAIEVYTQALKIDPKNADVRTDLGIMYRRQGDPDRAIAEFRQAAQDDPQHVNSRYNLGLVLLHDKGDLKGALAAWQDYLKLEPSGPRADNMRMQIEKLKAMSK